MSQKQTPVRDKQIRQRVIAVSMLAVIGLSGFPAAAQTAPAMPSPPLTPVSTTLTPMPDAAPMQQPQQAPVQVLAPGSSQPIEQPALPVTAAAPQFVSGSGEALFVAPQLSDTALLATADAKRHVRDGSVMPDQLTTLFFTAWQHALLQEAKIGFNTRLPDGSSPAKDQANKAPGRREIALGGIAFANTEKWTVWMNGGRITPTAIPKEILDIKVTQAYVDVKWFDDYTNKIYPIRLRPQERFNLDTRIFLPGNGPDGAM